MAEQDEISGLRKEINRLSSTVPLEQLQKWGAMRATSYRQVCKEARSLAAKARATEQQLKSKLSELRTYWSAP